MRELVDVETPPASPLTEETVADILKRHRPDSRRSRPTSTGSSSAVSDDNIGPEENSDDEALGGAWLLGNEYDGDTLEPLWSFEGSRAEPPPSRRSSSSKDVLVEILLPTEKEGLPSIDPDVVSEVLSDSHDLTSNDDVCSEALEDKDNPLLGDSDCETSDGDSGVSCGSGFSWDDVKVTGNSQVCRGKRPLEPEEQMAEQQLYSSCLKDELKWKIKYRRFSTGKEEVKEDELFVKKEFNDEISYEAIQRRNELRERNKMYAKMSRERASKKYEQLQEDCKRLLLKRKQLEMELTKMRSDKKKLEKLMLKHFSTCQRLDTMFFADPTLMQPRKEKVPPPAWYHAVNAIVMKPQVKCIISVKRHVSPEMSKDKAAVILAQPPNCKTPMQPDQGKVQKKQDKNTRVEQLITRKSLAEESPNSSTARSGGSGWRDAHKQGIQYIDRKPQMSQKRSPVFGPNMEALEHGRCRGRHITVKVNEQTTPKPVSMYCYEKPLKPNVMFMASYRNMRNLAPIAQSLMYEEHQVAMKCRVCCIR